MRTGDRHNPRPFAGSKAGNLRGARKARTDNAYANGFVRTHLLFLFLIDRNVSMSEFGVPP